MDLNHIISVLPSPIAVPYQNSLNIEDPQRKDYQRVTLENVLTFNAIVLISFYFKEFQASQEEDSKRKVSLPEISLKHDLSQMSLGKWNGVCRDISKELSSFVTEKGDKLIWNLVQKYHGKNKSWSSDVDKLIEQRNVRRQLNVERFSL